MSQYTVEEVTIREDLDCIIDVIWAAMDGFDPSHQIFFPILGDGAADREAAVQSSKDRTWEDHKSDSSSHWIFDEMDGLPARRQAFLAPHTKLVEALTAMSLGLSLMCVYPEFQRRGVGRLLMEWGLAKIDGLGLESFIEATDSGKGLYARCGYRFVKKVSVNVDRADATAGWKELSVQLMPIGYTAMWRPREGIWTDGEPQSTWDERLKSTMSRSGNVLK
ncbi:MAG: hypothetical protein Q9161_007430 [Pseudevernia consocians]